jgi:hypothetical protein
VEAGSSAAGEDAAWIDGLLEMRADSSSARLIINTLNQDWLYEIKSATPPPDSSSIAIAASIRASSSWKPGKPESAELPRAQRKETQAKLHERCRELAAPIT